MNTLGWVALLSTGVLGGLCVVSLDGRNRRVVAGGFVIGFAVAAFFDWIWANRGPWEPNTHCYQICTLMVLCPGSWFVRIFEARALPQGWDVNCWNGVIYGVAAYAYASAVNAMQKADRANRGTCVNCSYDLTGNTSGVCPECGRYVANQNSKDS